MIHILPGWIPSQDPTYPAMFRQACHLAKHVQVLLSYDTWPWFHRSCRSQAVNPNSLIVKNIVPLQQPICIGGGATMDVAFRNLCRSIVVAPPSDTDWSLEWAQGLSSAAAMMVKNRIQQQWDMLSYVAHLPEHRWVRRVLAWDPTITSRQVRRPRHMWDDEVAAFCRYKELRQWLEYAKDFQNRRPKLF